MTPNVAEYAGVLLGLLMDDGEEEVRGGPCDGWTRRQAIESVVADVLGVSYLWCSRDYAVLSVTGVDEFELKRALEDFDDNAWVALGQPRPGLTLYRRRTWMDRLPTWLGLV